MALHALGCVAREQGRYARARELHAESLGEFTALDDRLGMASAHSSLGFAAWLQGDFAEATAECTQALVVFSELGDVEGAAGELLNGGTTLFRGAEKAGISLPDLRELHLMTAKPFLYVFNMDVGDLEDAALRKQLTEARADVTVHTIRGIGYLLAPTSAEPN